MKWINVKKKMPPIGCEVLVYRKGYYPSVQIDTQNVYRGANNCAIFQNGCNPGEVLEVTHWMPLPEPPKETL